MAESRFDITGSEEVKEDGSRSVSIEIRREPNGAPDDTVWGVARQIVDLAPEVLEPHLRTIEAKIKRLSHHEKLSTYQRVKQWIHWCVEAGGQDKPGVVSLGSLIENVTLKIKTHDEWSKKSDQDIVTW